MKTQSRRTRMRGWPLGLERLLLSLGVAFLVFYAAAQMHATLSSRLALWAFQTVEAARSDAGGIPDPAVKKEEVDFSLWSAKRILAYKESLALKLDTPVAVLNIPRLGITAPVFDGTDDLTLNRGLGRIRGTARPGEDGNIGIAGHRDGFFRGLKDIAPGDSIEIVTTRGRDLYVVDGIVIVEPSDVSVLQPRPAAGITLVTCYPFYFVGDAPSRYIVRASLKQRALEESPGNPSTH